MKRVPRKLKKKYKNIWSKRPTSVGKIFIIKSSVNYAYGVWECITRTK